MYDKLNIEEVWDVYSEYQNLDLSPKTAIKQVARRGSKSDSSKISEDFQTCYCILILYIWIRCFWYQIKRWLESFPKMYHKLKIEEVWAENG